MTPYPARTPSDDLGQQITRLGVATVIPVFGLFILRLVLASLPMIKNAGPIGDLGVTPLLVVKAALDTVIYFLVIRFSLGVSEHVKLRRPHLAEIGTVILLTGLALVATLAYSGYQGMMEALAPTQMEVYNWLFLGIVLIPIGVIVVLVTRRLDFFSNLVFGKLDEALSQPAAFAAAASAPHSAGPALVQRPPAGPPPPAAPPAADPALQQVRDRLQTISKKVTRANLAIETLREKGALTRDLAEAASNMQGYLSGASQSLESHDAAAAKGFADWAEYEASRILQAA